MWNQNTTPGDWEKNLSPGAVREELAGPVDLIEVRLAARLILPGAVENHLVCNSGPGVHGIT